MSNEYYPVSIDNISMPYSTEAEQSVLGAVLLDSACLSELISIVRAEHFYSQQHQQIFSAMVRLFSKNIPVDFVTVLNELVSIQVFDEVSGKTYLFTLAQKVPSISNAPYYAKIVREKFEMRSLILAAKEIITDASDESNDPKWVLDAAEQKIYEIAGDRAVGGLQKIDGLITATFEHLQSLTDPENSDYRALSSGISTLDKVITGLNRTDLIILAARPGMGKTSFALNIARNVAMHERKKVAFFSLEMTREQLVQRLLASEGSIKGEKLRTGELTDDEWVRLIQAADVLMDAPVYVDEAGNITVTEMKAKLRRLNDVGLVVIDYLQLMRSGGRNEGNRVQEVSEITRNLKIMAKELNVPVICLSQLSRATEDKTRKGHRPNLSDLRDSGSIEQDADIVLFLYREDYYAKDEEAQDDAYESKNQSYCIVAKNRHGETADVPLHWQGEFMRFTALEGFRSE